MVDIGKNNCKECFSKPVITVCSNPMCRRHFVKYFEKRVIKTIKDYGLITMKDRHIAVACSGGKDSTALLYFLHRFLGKTGRKVTAVCIDEGIKGYREHTLKDLERFCLKNEIHLKVFSFKKELGLTLDQALKKHPEMKPCSVCGVFRRYLLNSKTREMGLEKIATGHNLDDEAQTVLMDLFRRNVRAMARMGPLTGIKADKKFISRVKPLYMVTEREVMTYAYLHGLCGKYLECPYSMDSLRWTIRDLLNSMEAKHPGTKQSTINSLLEMLPCLKAQYGKYELSFCKICGEPCTGVNCVACGLAEKLLPKARKGRINRSC